MDLAEYSDEELLEAGREAVKREQWPRAEAVSVGAYVDRYTAARRGDAGLGPGELRALPRPTHGSPKRGLELASKAQHADPRNAAHLLVHRADPPARPSRARTRSTRSSGACAPLRTTSVLLRMRKRLGVRQAPPLPFLDRRHALNVRLGRIMHKIKGTSPSMLPA